MDAGNASLLAAFADAVREKDKWHTKVLDQPGLLAKWATEAKLAEQGVSDNTLEAQTRCEYLQLFDLCIGPEESTIESCMRKPVESDSGILSGWLTPQKPPTW